MSVNKFNLKWGFIILLIMAFSFSQVALEIKNVDTSAGTLEIYMTNKAGCSYCPDSTYNNNTLNWTHQKNYCELPGAGDTTWVAYNTSLDSTGCAALPGFQAQTGGWWFNGKVGGFQFELLGIDVSAVSGGTAATAFGTNILTSTAAGAPSILAFSTTGVTIPSGDDQLLTNVSFSNFNNIGICFGEDVTSADANTLSSANGGYIDVNWGDCYCTSDNPPDCAGICGGTTTDSDEDGICNDEDPCPYDKVSDDLPDYNDADGDGVCGDTDKCVGFDDTVDADSDGVADGCDTCANTASGATVDATGCETTASIHQIRSNLIKEFSISQNFPNPFNPVTGITFDVAKLDDISVVVYDLAGKEIATLVSGTYAPGRYMIEWNAVNNTGNSIVSGMYIYRFKCSEKSITRRMLYLK